MSLKRAWLVVAFCVVGVAAHAEDGAKPERPISGAAVAADNSYTGVDKNFTIRYQAIALPKPNGAIGDRLMILDTQTGDVWQWWDNVAQKVGRTGVTYMGRMKPGDRPGETITYQRFDAPRR